MKTTSRQTATADEGRVNCIAPAVYTQNSGLDCTVKSYIDLVAARHSLKQALGPGSGTA